MTSIDPLEPRHLWLVGSRARVEEQAQAWTSPRYVPHALPWSDLVVRLPAAQVLAALRYHRPDVVLLTSASAVAMLGAGQAAGQAAACVGETTGVAAGRVGFETVLVGRAGALALAEALLARSPRPRRVLWLRGEEALREGAERLRQGGVTVEEVISYAAEPRAEFVAEVRAAPDPAVVLVQSPRAADALADALLACDRVLPRACGLYGLGASAGDRLRDLGFGGATSIAPSDLRVFFAGLP